MTELLKDGFPNTQEAELAFAIGKRAKNVSEAQALDCVFGYTIHNDVSGHSSIGRQLLGRLEHDQGDGYLRAAWSVPQGGRTRSLEPRD